MSGFFDTHCHLADISPHIASSDLTSFIQDASDSYLSVATQPNDWSITLQLAKTYPQVYAAIGLHPWFVTPDFASALQALNEHLKNSEIKAIGEIGLDFVEVTSLQKASQRAVFEAQLMLAKEFGLPVSLHCRKAFNDMLLLLKQYGVPNVMHGFSGGAEMGKQFVASGSLLGVNGVILKPNARRYHETVKAIGLAHLVLETDAPNTKGLPVYAQLNQIHSIAQKVAELLNVSVEQVKEITYQNAVNLFVKDD